jgi:cellulose synthase/poly-beta-1,6-N-acetylglucosamine synthase-like glycosyltransferase
LITNANILLIIYALLGPLPWLFLVTAIFLARSRMMRLKTESHPLPDPPPHVTVIVPAKEEGARIAGCIRRVLALDYPSFDVIAVNDRSSDDTGAILDELARESPGRLRVQHIQQLPDGWLGKSHALHVASHDARGEWLLFVDSDVVVEPNSLRDVLAICAQRKYDALSILTRLECHTFLERLILPLAAGAWTFIFAISLTNDDELRNCAAANGQFFMIRRDAYDSVGGHEAVRDDIIEDVELARLLKASGKRVRFLFGNHLAATRMHSTWSQMLNGWGRIYSGTARRRTPRIIAAMLFVLIAGFSLFPALCYGIVDWHWLIVSLVHAGLIGFVVGMIYRGARVPYRYVLLFPISAAALSIFLGYALRLCRTGKINWRGAQFTLRDRAHPQQAASSD